MAMKARPLGRKGVVVGDRVRVVGDVSGDDGSLARIVEVVDRTTVLRRTADDDDPVERVIVSNADQLVVVTALADPEPQPRLVDRALVAAYDAGMTPLLCLTKSDLADPDDVPVDLPLAGGAVGRHAARRRPHRADASGSPGRVSVLVGSSGVGKSTLVNALVPDAFREVGIVNAVTGRGRHTSTSAYMLPLPGRRCRLDHRHARHPLVRAGAREAGGPDRGVPRPRRDDRGLPARVHARRGRAGVRARRGARGRARRTRTGCRRSVGCWPRGADRSTTS